MLNILIFLLLGEKSANILRYYLISSKSLPERLKNGIFLYRLAKVTTFYFMSGKIFTDRLHKVLFGFKMGLSASVFHCKNNSKKYGDLSLQKVLKISPNLRLSILINLVLIKEEYSTPRKIIFLVLSLYWNNVIRIYIGTMPKIIFTFVSSIF